MPRTLPCTGPTCHLLSPADRNLRYRMALSLSQELGELGPNPLPTTLGPSHPENLEATTLGNKLLALWDSSALPAWPHFPIGEPRGLFPPSPCPAPVTGGSPLPIPHTPPRTPGPSIPACPSIMPNWGPLHPAHRAYSGPHRGPLFPPISPETRDQPVPDSWAPLLTPPSVDMDLDPQRGRYQCRSPERRATPFGSRQKVLAHLGRVHSLSIGSFSDVALLSLGVWPC